LKIIEHVRKSGISRILVIGPPPVDGKRFAEFQKERDNLDEAVVTRSFEQTEEYNEAAKSLSLEQECCYIDLFSTFLSEAKTKDEWKAWFCDGLHFGKKANELVSLQVVNTIKKHFPELSPLKLPLWLPGWREALHQTRTAVQ